MRETDTYSWMELEIEKELGSPNHHDAGKDDCSPNGRDNGVAYFNEGTCY